jgi:hypothetical protein
MVRRTSSSEDTCGLEAPGGAGLDPVALPFRRRERRERPVWAPGGDSGPAAGPAPDVEPSAPPLLRRLRRRRRGWLTGPL